MVWKAGATLGPVPTISGPEPTSQNRTKKLLNQKTTSSGKWGSTQAQAAAHAGLPRLRQLQVLAKLPTDHFAEIAESDQQMQKI